MIHDDLAALPSAEFGGGGPYVAVGWLGSGHAYNTTGEVHLSDLMRLDALARLRPARIMRGWHYRDLCTPPELSEETLWYRDIWEFSRKGHAEIHVPSESVTHVAPTLVVHYVTEHMYVPPREFLRALRSLSSREIGPS